MNFNNLILVELLDDDIVQRNFIKILIEEDLNQLLLPNNLHERGIRQKNENYYEEIVPLYSNSLFKEHFRMSRTAIDVSKCILNIYHVKYTFHFTYLNKYI